MDWDIAKVIVVLALLIWYVTGIRRDVSPGNNVIILLGLCLLLFASVLDYADGFSSLRNVPILGGGDPWHDMLEDQLGDTPGLALLALGAFREILRRRSCTT